MRARTFLPLILVAACGRDGGDGKAGEVAAPNMMASPDVLEPEQPPRQADSTTPDPKAPDPTLCAEAAMGTPDLLAVTSTAFETRKDIPREYTCQGADVSPPLAWTGAPSDTKSFAIIVDDPDVPDPAKPERTWVHWVVVNLPATTTSLARGASAALPKGASGGRNDWDKDSWGGPCPPIGKHRYAFKVYALDTTISGHPNKKVLLDAMKFHVRACGSLVGMYEKAPAE